MFKANCLIKSNLRQYKSLFTVQFYITAMFYGIHGLPKGYNVYLYKRPI